MSAAGELRLRGMFDTGFVTFSWQDDGSIAEEILETMRMAVSDLDEVKNILETKIREHNQRPKSFESMKILCNNFNKIIETLLSLWKGTHKLQELHQFPSLTFLEHVVKRSYKNSVRSSSALQGYDKKTFLMIGALFKHFHLTEDDVLTEICCGSESVVLQVSATSSFKCCYGILTDYSSTPEYENIAAEFTRWMEFYGKDYTEFQLYYEDLMSGEMLKLISNSTVIFLKDLNVGSEMESKISSVFSQLEGNSRIISFENCSQLFAFSDGRSVDVKEYRTGQCDLRYFLHTIKPQSMKATTQMETQSSRRSSVAAQMETQSSRRSSVAAQMETQSSRRSSVAAQMETQSSQSSVAVVQKRRQPTLTPTPPISTPATQKKFKAAGKTKDAHKLLSSAEAPAALISSLDNILSCYRNQFIKFIEFMQTKEYRLQLGEAVKSELMHKTELKNKIQSLLLQISELNSSRSQGTSPGEVDLSGLNHKSLLRKASDCYEKYVQLKEKVKTLEAEVATLEGKKENSTVSDRQRSTGSSLVNSVFKNTLTEHVIRQFPLKFGQALVADVSGIGSTSSLMKSSQSEQHSDVVPFSKGKTSMGLSYQWPKGVTATPSPCPSALRLYCPSTSGNSSMVLHGSNSRKEGSMSSLNNDQCSGFSSIGSGLANRRGSSSSTDTADSVQGPNHSVQNFEGNSISAWPNSPDRIRLEASMLSGHSSKSQQFIRSAMEQSVQSAELKMPHTLSVTQSLSKEMVSFSQTIPEVAPVTGKGQTASGKRGRRKRAVPEADDSKSKSVFYLGKRGKLAPLGRTDTDTGWRLISSEERDSGMRQDALLESRGLALGLHHSTQHPNEHGYAKPLKSDGTPTTKTDMHKAPGAGNLDALLLAVSLHHLPPSHRNLGQTLPPRSTEIPPQTLRKQLMPTAERTCSTSLLPLQLSSSSIVMATGQSPLTTLSWSLPQVSGSKPCPTMPNVFMRQSPVNATYDKQMETVDDSHGKHFKKRCHSSNVKPYRAKKIGSTADWPNPSTINETTAMPILKSLFSKRNEGASLLPIIQGGVDKLEVGEHRMHLPNDAQPSVSDGTSTGMQMSSRDRSNPTAETVNRTSNVTIPNSEMSQYMKVSCPSDPLKQVTGVSWFSLPLSLVRPVQMPRSDPMSLAADRLLSESDGMLSQRAPVFTAVSNQRTVISSLTSNLSLSSSISETRRDPHRADTKSSSC